RPSCLATNGVVCATFGGVTETPTLILRMSLQSCAAAGCAAAASRTLKMMTGRPRSMPRIASSSLGATADGGAAAGGLDRSARELEVDHLIERRFVLLVDVADRDVVVDGPLGALAREPFVDRPDAVLGQHIDGVFDRLLRLARRFDHGRDDLGLVAI